MLRLPFIRRFLCAEPIEIGVVNSAWRQDHTEPTLI